jgi:hypothetical protein
MARADGNLYRIRYTATPTPTATATATATLSTPPTPTPRPRSTATATATAPRATPTAPSGGLLSQGRPVTASSTENASFPAANAVDGNTGTRWASAFSDPQWISVDLGATASITRVHLNWEAAYGSAYQIQVSNDNASWTTVASVTGGNGAIDEHTLAASGRYVRMNGTTRATAWGYSLWEFQVYGTIGGPTPTATAPRATATATATTPRATATATATTPRATARPTVTATPRTRVTPTTRPRITATATATTPRATATATAPRATPTSGGNAWAPGVAYSVGTVVTYGGSSYSCRQAHTSQVGWEPPNVPALWLAQ